MYQDVALPQVDPGLKERFNDLFQSKVNVFSVATDIINDFQIYQINFRYNDANFLLILKENPAHLTVLVLDYIIYLKPQLQTLTNISPDFLSIKLDKIPIRITSMESFDFNLERVLNLCDKARTAKITTIQQH